ncbi:MAG: amidohydrolase family protein [Xanthomonadaceae bacterium]|nr:amidohydrolase family protein [Xanthomonadaceae bacterium]
MDEAGVLTGLHSDNPELARRMNLEAAKVVRYGGVDEHQALKMITAGPAAQLGIGERTGRLAEGLDADFVIWSGHPLSVYSRVEQTWVDGRRYFDRATDLEYRKVLAAERGELMAQVLEAGNDRDEEDADEQRGDDFEPGGLLGYRASELAHDEFCHAHGFGHVHAIDFRKGH